MIGYGTGLRSALAPFCDVDTPEIRDALVLRLTDVNVEVRGEAMVGLAVRGDDRVAARIVRELEAAALSSFAFDAANSFVETHPKHEAVVRALQKWR
jgi:hypothetical protein